MHFPGQDKPTPFVIFFSFLITFIIARLFVYFFPHIFINVRGVHIHHFAYGIIIMTIAGVYDLIVRTKDDELDFIALIYGIGLALSYDEFGMWLRLQDYYPVRTSYDAILIISLILLSLIYFDGFWTNLGKRLLSIFKKIT